MRVLVVNNPRAGLGRSELFDFTNMLALESVEVTLRYLAADQAFDDLLADASAFDAVVAAGGDGSISAVTYCLRGSGVPVLPFPVGTANLIASNLGLPSTARGLADVALAGRIAQVDVGELTYQRSHTPGGADPRRSVGFVMAAGAGFDARVIEGASGMKGAIGPAAYLIAALQNLTPTVSRFTLSLDGRTVETEGIAVMLANFSRLQFDIDVTHQTDAQDGLMDVAVLRVKSTAELLPTIWAGFVDGTLNMPERPGLEVHKASEVELYADPPLPLQSDGEPLDGPTPIRARMFRRAARFLVPEGTRLEAY